jgi:ABC-type multidrug transport system ATPase subunit
MTGMVPVTGGDAVISGKSIKTDMAAIRRDLGICPQHDVLYPALTVDEHARMFAAIKGVPHARLEEECSSMIQAVGLTEKRKERSANLSGGQKRKLSL